MRLKFWTYHLTGRHHRWQCSAEVFRHALPLSISFSPSSSPLLPIIFTIHYITSKIAIGIVRNISLRKAYRIKLLISYRYYHLGVFILVPNFEITSEIITQASIKKDHILQPQSAPSECWTWYVSITSIGHRLTES